MKLEKCDCGGEMEGESSFCSLPWLKCSKCKRKFPYNNGEELVLFWNNRQKAKRIIKGWRRVIAKMDNDHHRIFVYEKELQELSELI